MRSTLQAPILQRGGHYSVNQFAQRPADAKCTVGNSMQRCFQKRVLSTSSPDSSVSNIDIVGAVEGTTAQVLSGGSTYTATGRHSRQNILTVDLERENRCSVGSQQNCSTDRSSFKDNSYLEVIKIRRKSNVPTADARPPRQRPPPFSVWPRPVSFYEEYACRDRRSVTRKRQKSVKQSPIIIHKLKPESARHIEFDGMRKATNWFSFYLHPCRSSNTIATRAVTSIVSASNRDAADETGTCVINCNNRIVRPAALRSSTDDVRLQFLRVKPVLLSVAKSSVHGVGVFSRQHILPGSYILEYKGELIRNSLVEIREKAYRGKGMGSYMFRLDNRFTIDGTMKGNIARFINHSCEPNCSAEVVTSNGIKHIIVRATKPIEPGAEILYDYKMPREAEKVPCLCRRPGCRKYLN